MSSEAGRGHTSGKKALVTIYPRGVYEMKGNGEERP